MKFTNLIVCGTLLAFLGICCSQSTPRNREILPNGQVVESLAEPQIAAGDWPGWRGPNRNGVAAEQPTPPLKWSASKNIRWKVDVPGVGHSSPTIVGDRVVLTTAEVDRKVQSVLCWRRGNGRLLWRTDVHRGNLPDDIHQDNSCASTSAAADGKRVFVAFENGRAIHLTALDLNGKLLWQTEVGRYKSEFGFGSSPAVFGSFVYVAADMNNGGFIAAVHRRTGKIRWRVNRPRTTYGSYCSPLVTRLAGRDQLLVSGCKMLAAYDPLTGQKLWSTVGTADLSVGKPVVEADRAYASGGYPDHEVLCVRDGGEVVWRNNTYIYSVSMLVHDGLLYGVKDDGIAHCWDSRTGDLLWKERLPGESYASPVWAAGRIYRAGRNGTTTVWQPGRRFVKLAENRLGDETFATPSIAGGRIYLRTAHTTGDRRQEGLYCIGNP